MKKFYWPTSYFYELTSFAHHRLCFFQNMNLSNSSILSSHLFKSVRQDHVITRSAYQAIKDLHIPIVHYHCSFHISFVKQLLDYLCHKPLSTTCLSLHYQSAIITHATSCTTNLSSAFLNNTLVLFLHQFSLWHWSLPSQVLSLSSRPARTVKRFVYQHTQVVSGLLIHITEISTEMILWWSCSHSSVLQEEENNKNSKHPFKQQLSKI